MLVLYKKNQFLYAKVELELRFPIKFENKKFRVGHHEDLLLPEEVMHVLTVNGNIRLWNGDKFVKLNLGQFYDIMKNKNYKVENYIEPVKQQEPKKEEPTVQPKVEPVKQQEPKAEQKVVEEPKKEEPTVQPKVEPVKQQEPKAEQKHENNNNKKQRHNNNNKQNNQGGDK